MSPEAQGGTELRRRSLRAGLALATGLAMSSGFANAPTALAWNAIEKAPTSSPQVNVWVTTADGQMKLSKQTPVAFTTSAPGQETLVVDPTREFQTMTGFGASITDSSASVLYSLSPTARDAAMHTLFDPRTGDGLDFLRQPIGASDFVAGSQHYTYDDVPSGQTDYLQRNFSVAHDEAQILPLLRQAAAINPDL